MRWTFRISINLVKWSKTNCYYTIRQSLITDLDHIGWQSLRWSMMILASSLAGRKIFFCFSFQRKMAPIKARQSPKFEPIADRSKKSNWNFETNSQDFFPGATLPSSEEKSFQSSSLAGNLDNKTRSLIPFSQLLGSSSRSAVSRFCLSKNKSSSKRGIKSGSPYSAVGLKD